MRDWSPYVDDTIPNIIQAGGATSIKYPIELNTKTEKILKSMNIMRVCNVGLNVSSGGGYVDR